MKSGMMGKMPHMEANAMTFGEEEGEFYYDRVHRIEPFERNNHYHGTYEVFYLVSGERHYFIKEKLYAIQAGDLVFINKFDVHKTSGLGDPEHERIVINFSDNFVSASQPLQPPGLLSLFKLDRPLLRLSPDEQQIMRSLFHKMEQEIAEQAPAYEHMLRILLTELLIRAGRMLDSAPAPAPVSNNPLHQKITDIVKHIHTFYSSKITLDALSSTFYISPYYLSRIFKEITGFTIINYVNLTRIRVAQQLLNDTDMKIVDIAEAVGFESLTHFDRTFKKMMGMTASKYRKGSGAG
ncbi:AraC family transcriptional regulator [Paenibacillus sp. FSL M8-0334]|uniref:helix-turn-helix transcriptional regulator n=1 Tax=Paenibacillus sp. FSL M8-0334 TaxID=2921623 RepID=UPI0030F82D04